MPAISTHHDEFTDRLQSALRRTRASQPPEPAPSASAGESAEASPADEGPVGDGNHLVATGESASLIALRSGHHWQTIWSDPANAPLRAARHDPDALRAGDRLYIMPLRPKSEPRATQQRHYFVRRGAPAVLRLTLRDDDGRPRADQPFVLELDDAEIRGTTDSQGRISTPVPPTARVARLRVGPEGQEQEIPVSLG